MRDYKATLKWYETHQTESQIGFDVDGACLRICRTARDLGARYPTAKSAQDNTPTAYRVYQVRDLRKGMVLFIDDPRDSNTAGHIVTMIGRVKGFDPDSLHDVLVETNGVKKNEVVVVRADYFTEHWGDKFQFGAFWLNGSVLDYFQRKQPATTTSHTLRDFAESRPDWDVSVLDAIGKSNPAVKSTVKQIEAAVESLPDDLKDKRVKQFKDAFEKDRVLKIHLLTEVVKDHPNATRVKGVRDDLRKHVKAALPR